jgi:hypothetical protein
MGRVDPAGVQRPGIQSVHYKSRRREQAGLEARIKEICATRVRYGYQRVHVLLRREAWEIDLKKTSYVGKWVMTV